jgi:hypothetical protein
MKKKLPPKKKFPFYAKVGGGNARARPDRMAYRRGGSVSAAKADLDPISPTEPNAPAGGKVTQKYRKGGGVKKLQGGGPTDDDTSTPRSSSLADLTSGIGGPPPPVSPAVPGQTGGYKRGGGVLSAAQRQSLPRSDFALPGKGEGPKGAGSGSYPIPDRSHAANALARSSGKPVAAQVRAKVRAKYPDMGQK